MVRVAVETVNTDGFSSQRLPFPDQGMMSWFKARLAGEAEIEMDVGVIPPPRTESRDEYITGDRKGV